MRPLLQDLRLAGRRLRRAPGFAVLASVTLALGVGAHAALAGWADATFLRPLPVPEPERLVGVYETRSETRGETRRGGFYPLSLPDFLDHRAGTEAFASLAAHYPAAPLVLGLPGGDAGTQEEIVGSVVSPGYFSVLGLAPVRGRFFTPGEATPGATPVVVVSHRFWRQRLGGRDDALGSVVRLNDTPFTVVGVAPASFRGVHLGDEPEVWMPTSMAAVGYRWCDASDRDCTWMEMVGRLAPGRTLEEARTEMALSGRRVRQAHPRPGEADQQGTGLTVAPLVGIHPSARPRALRLAGLLGSAVTLLLLVAAINLGGLLIARNLARQREIATRVAIGAGRWRVVRGALAEMAWIAAAGGLGGLLIAAWLGRVVVALLPGAGALDLAALPAVVGHGALLSLATGLGVGLAAGLQSARPDLAAAMSSRDASGGSGGSARSAGRGPRVLGTLLVAQVALSFVLLASAGLLVRSLRNAEGLSAVDPARVATLRLRPRLIDAEPERARAFTREALERLEALPGVESATLGRLLPPWSGHDGSSTEPEVVEVGPRFFETFGFPMVRGRAIDEGDGGEGPAVAVVGRALAQTLAQARLGERDPVGELLPVGDETYRVIGVVDDTAYRSATQASPAVVYVPYWRAPSRIDARVAVRTAGDAEELLGVLGRTVRSIDPAVPVTEIETLAARVDRLLGPTHAAERMIGASALLTLLLSAIGLYGLLSLAVAQGRRDIGIRLALGGSRPRVVGQVVRSALGLVALALGIGLAAAIGAARGLAHHLYEIDPHDPATLAAAVALFALVAAAAAWWPARRAARVDPAVTLRQG